MITSPIDSVDNSGEMTRLTKLVYDKLKEIAGAYLRRERKNHTLQATALVHEAYLKIADYDKTVWNSREDFLAFASHVMRQVLVDHAVRRNALKRGSRMVRRSVTQISLGDETDPLDVIILDEALKKLATLSHRRAWVVELRFFGGLSVPEVARAIHASESMVAREWREARAWLLCYIQGDAEVDAQLR